MAGKIYLIKNDEELMEINEKKHARELDFQELIKKYPDLIPGDQIDNENPRRWFYIGEEVHFPVVGNRNIRLDLLFLDQDGIPTLVELKRSEDSRVNSEVATQIMEYGANILMSMDTRSIRKMAEENNDISVTDFLNNDESDEEEFWEKVYDNLKSEKIRLLVIADEIPNRLQNILEFINRNMESVEILSVEIKQYANDDVTTLVSRVIGQSIEAQSKKIRKTGVEEILDRPTFFANIDENGRIFFDKLFKFAKKEHLKINCRTKGFSLNVPINGKNISLFRGFSKLAANGQHIVSTSGSVKNKVKNGDEILEEYIKELIKLDGFNKAGDGFIYKFESAMDENNWNKFEEINTMIIKQIRTNGLNG